ncbi:MAG: hypothetical protein QMC26_13160 [Pseudomonadales bacterium]|jgi:hypothetical protein|tara:strand:- start:2872 stop:3300 length:429 start_codon:yes stop_codon:yes gene_type:complete
MLEAASFAADISQQPEGAVIPEMPGYMRVREQGFPDATPPVSNTAANGHGNARSVMRAQGDMWGVGVKHGIGYGLTLFAEQVPEGTKFCSWAGAGGSTIIIDLTHRACTSYVMNQMGIDPRGIRLTSRFYEGLVRPLTSKRQ